MQQPGRGEQDASGCIGMYRHQVGIKSAATPLPAWGARPAATAAAPAATPQACPAGLWITSPDPQPAVRAGHPPSPSLQMLQVLATEPRNLQKRGGDHGGIQAGCHLDKPAQLHDPNRASPRLMAGVYRDKSRKCVPKRSRKTSRLHSLAPCQGGCQYKCMKKAPESLKALRGRIGFGGHTSYSSVSRPTNRIVDAPILSEGCKITHGLSTEPVQTRARREGQRLQSVWPMGPGQGQCLCLCAGNAGLSEVIWPD